jgi:tRNA(fMet)-specific endonuclease VapC
MKYLLDTNILSDLIRNPHGLAAKRLTDLGEEQVCTSIVVAGELRYGAAKRASARLTERVQMVLGLIKVVPLDAPADAAYASLRARLEGRGRPIGSSDLLIAAHAMALGCTLVTDNEREFNRIDGLLVENWLRSGRTRMAGK